MSTTKTADTNMGCPRLYSQGKYQSGVKMWIKIHCKMLVSTLTVAIMQAYTFLKEKPQIAEYV